jgi:hypothetical protein
VKPATEAGFLRGVLRLARLCGWRTLHIRPGRTLASGWRTPLQGDGVGWPDFLAVRGYRLVIAELKAEGGRLTAAQRHWLAALRQVPGVEVFCWSPRDWDQIETILA